MLRLLSVKRAVAVLAGLALAAGGGFAVAAAIGSGAASDKAAALAASRLGRHHRLEHGAGCASRVGAAADPGPDAQSRCARPDRSVGPADAERMARERR